MNLLEKNIKRTKDLYYLDALYVIKVYIELNIIVG